MGLSLPKSVICLRAYSFPKFLSDVIAGLTVGLVALPLAMAFAISSGVPPQSGIYCAIIAGFLISALGGSKTQVGGPTGAFVVVVYGIVAKHGIDGLFLCTMMAGVILIVLGVTGTGTLVKFIPRPVIVGFTNGIAILIASTQVKDFFGLQMEKVPGEFWSRMEALLTHFDTLALAPTLLAATALVIVVLSKRFVRRIPGSIIALVLGTCVVAAIGLPVETIGTRFGGIPSGLPSLAVPRFEVQTALTLLSPALTVAMLGAIESLLSAVVSDRMCGDRHDPNVELVAQGVANIASPLFGGLPATGAIARTATNIRSGATTPVSGMVHALTLLAVLLFAAPLAQYIPLAVLAAILMVVAYNMGEWDEIPELLKLTWADITVWLVTLLLTLFADLTLAVEVGIVLAALLYIRKVTRTTTVEEVTEKDVENGWVHVMEDKLIPHYVSVFRIHGPFLFGATVKLAVITDQSSALPSIIILRLREMTALDATGLLALEDLADTLHAANRALILCGAQPQPARLMQQAEFEDKIGKENVCANIRTALERAKELFQSDQTLQRSA